MNNFYKKKDFKTLLLLFSIEAVILVFMCVIAHFITSDNIVRNQNNNDFTSSMSLVSEEVLGKSFNGKGISALKNLNSIENDNNTEVGAEQLTPYSSPSNTIIHPLITHTLLQSD